MSSLDKFIKINIQSVTLSNTKYKLPINSSPTYHFSKNTAIFTMLIYFIASCP